MSEYENFWRDDLTNEQYHAIKDYESSSQIKIVITETPLDYIDTIRNGSKIKPTEDMNLSSIAHSMILEGEDFMDRYAEKPKFFDDDGKLLRGNSNLYKEKDKEWIAKNRNKLVVTSEELHQLEGMYEGLHRNDAAVTLLKDGLFERSGFYVDPGTGKKLRMRYDCYDPSSRWLIDLKAMRDVSYKTFSSEILYRRYDFSLAMYGEGIFEIDQTPVDEYWFIGVMKTRPYHCVVYPIKKEIMKRARDDYFKALALIDQCTKNKKWPGLAENLKPIGYPDWYERKLEYDDSPRNSGHVGEDSF